MFDLGYKDCQTMNVPRHPGDPDYMKGWNQMLWDDIDNRDTDYFDDEVYEEDDYYYDDIDL